MGRWGGEHGAAARRLGALQRRLRVINLVFPSIEIFKPPKNPASKPMTTSAEGRRSILNSTSLIRPARHILKRCRRRPPFRKLGPPAGVNRRSAPRSTECSAHRMKVDINVDTSLNVHPNTPVSLISTDMS